jgi:hypothetical protein
LIARSVVALAPLWQVLDLALVATALIAVLLAQRERYSALERRARTRWFGGAGVGTVLIAWDVLAAWVR